VTLRPGSSSDQASWLGIRYAAVMLLDECEREGRLRVLRTGGWAMLGIANRIVVELTKVKVSGAVGGGNLTAGGGELGLDGTAIDDE